MLAGLLLTIIKEDMIVLISVSGAISIGSLVAWIINLAGRSYSVSAYGYSLNYGTYGYFTFTPLFYFLLFGGIAVLVLIKSEKFKAMRSASAARAVGVNCPKCGGFIPMASAFCAQCGTPNPGPAQYAPPAAPHYAPPAAPQYAPPAAPQYAPPAAPQYAPPAAPAEPVPAAPAMSEPVLSEPVVSEPAAMEPAPAANLCKNCGVELPAGAMFCGKCGTKQ
jgi:ribosomal protein L40E